MELRSRWKVDHLPSQYVRRPHLIWMTWRVSWPWLSSLSRQPWKGSQYWPNIFETLRNMGLRRKAQQVTSYGSVARGPDYTIFRITVAERPTHMYRAVLPDHMNADRLSETPPATACVWGGQVVELMVARIYLIHQPICCGICTFCLFRYIQ